MRCSQSARGREHAVVRGHLSPPTFFMPDCLFVIILAPVTGQAPAWMWDAQTEGSCGRRLRSRRITSCNA